MVTDDNYLDLHGINRINSTGRQEAIKYLQYLYRLYIYIYIYIYMCVKHAFNPRDRGLVLPRVLYIYIYIYIYI